MNFDRTDQTICDIGGNSLWRSDNCVPLRCQPDYVYHENGCHTVTLMRCIENKTTTHIRDYFEESSHSFHATVVFYSTNIPQIPPIYQSCNNNSDQIYFWGLKSKAFKNEYQCHYMHVSNSRWRNFVQAIDDRTVMDILLPGVDMQRLLLFNFKHMDAVQITDNGPCKSKIYHSVSFGEELPMLDVLSGAQSLPMLLDVSYGKNSVTVESYILACNMTEPVNQCLYDNNRRLENCPKVSVNFHELSSKISSSQINVDKHDYIALDNTTVLICAYLYKQMWTPRESLGVIVTGVSYSISIICLLTTVVIYIRLPSLRTIPGLMLMNLIVSLLVAQVSHTMSYLDIFKSYPLICQIIATVQHYFWLCAFAWMFAMSLDIFKSLAIRNAVVQNSSRLRKYAACCWVIPVALPALAITLSFMNVTDLGYTTVPPCWLANTQSVLYLFAIPVLVIITINLILFLGSLLRLRSLVEDAALLGLKENRGRLCSCVKIASWMGLSWLFGILPNLIHSQALWYMFVVGNSMQGVQIFLAFGLTRRNIKLLRVSNNDKTKLSQQEDGTTQSTGSIPG